MSICIYYAVGHIRYKVRQKLGRTISNNFLTVEKSIKQNTFFSNCLKKMNVSVLFPEAEFIKASRPKYLGFWPNM